MQENTKRKISLHCMRSDPTEDMTESEAKTMKKTDLRTGTNQGIH